jgi:hypothetical protein
MPSFNSSRVRGFGGPSGNSTRWISSKVNCPHRRTTILSPSSSHSRTEPGPTANFRRTSAGTEICPWAVILDRARAICLYYHGNATCYDAYLAHSHGRVAVLFLVGVAPALAESASLLGFEPNAGQFPPEVRFARRSSDRILICHAQSPIGIAVAETINQLFVGSASAVVFVKQSVTPG